MKIDHPDNVY